MPKTAVALVFFVFFLTIDTGFAGCDSNKLAIQKIFIERNGITVATVNAEIARTDDERSLGLMFREKLPDGDGMLFVFERDEILAFWMKNTLIPLSIAFITSDCRIVEIKNMYPHDLNTTSSGRSVRYALEVPQGWFGRAGVQIGDIIKFN